LVKRRRGWQRRRLSRWERKREIMRVRGSEKEERHN
jgi:hypothetical protein